MAIEKVRNYLKKFNAEGRVLEFAESSATVELAAKAAGTQPERIAKSLTFMVNEAPIMIVAAGDAKATVWTCDFSYEYVKINGEYHT